MLLAVAPDVAEPWTFDALADTVTETADLARIRMVGPEEVPWLGRYLPALLHVADNAAGDTLTVDLHDLRRQCGGGTAVSRSITTWLRIEPQSDAIPPGPDAALQARISDPAWMLGRQWQLGELTGDDAGSPVGVRLRAAAAPLTRLQCGGPDGAVQEIEPTDPLEPLVQAEAGQAATWSAALARGIHFLQALDLAGLDDLIPALRDAFPCCRS